MNRNTTENTTLCKTLLNKAAICDNTFLISAVACRINVVDFCSPFFAEFMCYFRSRELAPECYLRDFSFLFFRIFSTHGRSEVVIQKLSPLQHWVFALTHSFKTLSMKVYEGKAVLASYFAKFTYDSCEMSSFLIRNWNKFSNRYFFLRAILEQFWKYFEYEANIIWQLWAGSWA